MEKNQPNPFRLIPSIEKLLKDPQVSELGKLFHEDILKRGLRLAVERLRDAARSGSLTPEECSPEVVIDKARDIISEMVGQRLRRVINATGVIVHTNLGRSPLSRSVADRIASVAVSYSNLEYDIKKGRRGERNSHLHSLMKELTGAESALAVNNNAAAVFLALSALAYGKEVVVSRGELIEIGGSFRIPDVMARSGAILREVGTTNRTHPKDYVQAINENTALILKVHTSNYRIVGFTREVEIEELVSIGREHSVPTMMDLGSGCLVDLAPYGLPEEITVQRVISAGVDVVSFSGDKLLGGPQAGILAGKKDFIEKMRTYPLARALRMDKLTMAGLEATLMEYAKPEEARNIPTIDMIMRPVAELEESAARIAASIREQADDLAEVTTEPGVGRVGGGALPMSDLPGPRVAIRPTKITAAKLEQYLREFSHPPLITLVKDDSVMIDPRTLLNDDPDVVPGMVVSALKHYV